MTKLEEDLTRLFSALWQRSHTSRPRRPRHLPATQPKQRTRSGIIESEAEDEAEAALRQEVTSSMYSSRSRAFLKSYSLARRLSSQMYSCREADRPTKSAAIPRDPKAPIGRRPRLVRGPYWSEASHLYEAVGVEQRHGVGVLQLLLQQLPRQRLLVQQEALLLYHV